MPRGLTKVHTASVRAPRSAVTTRRTESGRADVAQLRGDLAGRRDLAPAGGRRADRTRGDHRDAGVHAAGGEPAGDRVAPDAGGTIVPSIVKTSSPAAAS